MVAKLGTEVTSILGAFEIVQFYMVTKRE